jgi:membrane-associated phospholipid phosphatase
VITLEQTLHVFIEPGIQTWALHKKWLMDIADSSYLNAHYVLTIGALVWIYLRRNDSFYFVRNMFAIAFLLAIVGYILVPTAPPRFLPEWGFQDTVSDLFGDSASSTASVLYNPYAAMPSMHVAFALMVAIPASQLVHFTPVKVLWWIYPLVVTFVVISTGNHFWLDAAIGAVVAGCSALIAKAAFGRARPEDWAWRTAAAEARA